MPMRWLVAAGLAAAAVGPEHSTEWTPLRVITFPAGRTCRYGSRREGVLCAQLVSALMKNKFAGTILSTRFQLAPESKGLDRLAEATQRRSALR